MDWTAPISRGQRRWLVIAFAAVVVGFSVVPVVAQFRGRFKDYGKWAEAGQVVLRGGELYPDPAEGRSLPFMYPPFFAVLVTPLAAMGMLPLVLVMLAATSAAWLAAALLSVWLATGRVSGQPAVLYWAPSVVCLGYVWDAYLLGQPNLILLALMLGGLALLRVGRSWGAGTLVALAAAIKAFPIMAVGYLLWRRYWVATAATLLFLAVFVVLVPAPLRGLRQNVRDLRTWATAMLFKFDDRGIAQRENRGNSWKNQSLLAVGNRLLRRVDADDHHGRQLYVNVADLPAPAVGWVVAGLGLGLCLFYVACMPRERRRTPASDAAETAMLTVLIVIFTPLGFIYSYVWLLYPLTVGLHCCLSEPNPGRRRALAAWLATVAVLLALALVSQYAKALGNTLWASLMLLAGLGWELRRMARAPAAACA